MTPSPHRDVPALGEFAIIDTRPPSARRAHAVLGAIDIPHGALHQLCAAARDYDHLALIGDADFPATATAEWMGNLGYRNVSVFGDYSAADQSVSGGARAQDASTGRRGILLKILAVLTVGLPAWSFLVELDTAPIAAVALVTAAALLTSGGDAAERYDERGGRSCVLTEASPTR